MLLASTAIAFRDASSKSNIPSSFGTSRNGCVWACAGVIARGSKPMMVAEEAAATDRMKLRRDICLRIFSSRSRGVLAGTNPGRTRVRPTSASEAKLCETEGSPALDIASREGGWLEGWPRPVQRPVWCHALRCAPQMSDWMPALGNSSRPDKPILLQRLERFHDCLEKSSFYVSDDADFSPPSTWPDRCVGSEVPIGRRGTNSTSNCEGSVSTLNGHYARASTRGSN